MSKIVVLLALYAAAVATFLLVESRKDGGGGNSGRALQAASEGHPDLRRLMGEARALMRQEVKETLKNIDWRLARMDTLYKSMQAGLQAAQAAAEDAADANYGKLESLEEVVEGFGKATARLEGVQQRLGAIEKRIAALEQRPPQVIREIVREKGGAAEPRKGPLEPRRPTLPVKPRKDPAKVAAETAKALRDLESNDLDVLFPAIEKVREHRVMAAVPRLLQVLATHKDEFGRTAAAAALGKMKVADAVPALTEALVDKSDMVAQQASRSIRDITEFDTQMPASAGIRKRRTVRNRVKEWWRSHEEEVRKRLGQPKTAAAGG